MGRKRNEELWKLIREKFPIMTALEIQKEYGIPINKIKSIAFYIGVKHNKKTQERINQERIDHCNEMRKNLDPVKAARKREINRKLDEYRVWMGKEQQTRMKIRKYPKRTSKAKSYLIHHYHYESSYDDYYTLLITSKTRRATNENLFSSKYNFKFIQKNDKKTNNGQ